MQAAEIPDPRGQYQDAAGNRFAVCCCNHLLLPPGSPLAITETDSLAAYLAARGLAAVPPAPEQAFAAAVAAGYTVPGVEPPLVLDMSDPARVLFHQLSYQLMTMQAAGRISGTDLITITDIEGNPRSFPAAQVQTMIMDLGAAYLSLFTALHSGNH